MRKERFLLAAERIKEISTENGLLPENFERYFHRTAEFILLTTETLQYVETKEIYRDYPDALKTKNHKLYEDILPSNYEVSFANPVYAGRTLGEEFGKLLSFLYAEIRSLIVFAHELQSEEMLIRMELFLEIYGSFVCAYLEMQSLPKYEEIKETVYWFVSDYTREATAAKLGDMLCPEHDFALRILMESDLNNERYLYYFGEYISENEVKMWKHLNCQSEETIQLMADTYTEGYRIGFLTGGKDISLKRTVNIRYCLGFERMIQKAVQNFERMGLKTTIYRASASMLQGKGIHRIGYYGAIPNKQYDFDHKDDQAMVLDKGLVRIRLEAWQEAYEAYKEQAAVFGGPAVVEVFGETPADLLEKKEAIQLSKEQQKLVVEYMSKAGEIQNRYIKGEERSFTIIAFPTPDIGEKFPEIFNEVIKINTLDYKKYQTIQQTMIDTLDKGSYVLVKGMGKNKTNMRIALHQLDHSGKQTNFENCVADVNIPVGEVFTSPVLKGTDGMLHVTRVYLNQLEYKDITLTIKDGMVAAFTCSNFDTEEMNRKYIMDNVLFHHETLPLGEFAIGTNTTAYAVGRKYDIADRFPILIAEKTGPHFALGDTCYSHSEEVKVFNPDGKEMIAKDNECSWLRKGNVDKAYFNCHTDITIPYDELGEISIVTESEEVIPIIEEGRFVLPGCEELNGPMEEYGCL